MHDVTGLEVGGLSCASSEPWCSYLRDIEPQTPKAIHNRRKGLDGLANHPASPALRSNARATRVKL